MEQKRSKLRDCFRPNSCKCFACDNNKDLITDPLEKASILDAEVHKDLLNNETQPVQDCNRENCWECTNTLC